MPTNTRWYTRHPVTFEWADRAGEGLSDEEIAASVWNLPAGTEIEPELGGADTWCVAPDSDWQAKIPVSDIFTVWTNENGAQQIRWQTAEGSHVQYGIVALALELFNEKEKSNE